MPPRHTTPLETVSVTVPEPALEAYEAALDSVCDTVGFFRDEATGTWRVEGVKQVGSGDAELAAALAIAAGMSGTVAPLHREATEAEGWLARSYAGFPEQQIGRRFAVRGTHLPPPDSRARITLLLDAGLAFGSGEHGSTRGCLLALERVAHRRPQRILDLGTGSGILAIAAARLLHRRVLATDIEPWSVRVAYDNARLNGVAELVHVRLADGWRDPRIEASGPYDLVFANILARPLCAMAKDLSVHLAAGGTGILSGLLAGQARAVLMAHRWQGLRLERQISVGPWTTLVLRAAQSSEPRAPARSCPLR